MSKSNTTVEAVLNLVREMGCEVLEQKSFFKITNPKEAKKALYVGKTKRGLTRVDIAGFEPEEHDAIRPMSAETAKSLKLGAVRGQIEPKKLAEDVDVLEGIQVAVRGLFDGSEGFKLGKKPVEEEAAPEAQASAQ